MYNKDLSLVIAQISTRTGGHKLQRYNRQETLMDEGLNNATSSLFSNNHSLPTMT